MPEHLRQASWREVVALFPDERAAIQNARGWAKRYGREEFTVGQWLSVSLETWTEREIDEAMVAMSQLEPRMTVDMVDGVNNATLPPRVDGLPLVVVRFGDRIGMIDGKHRANRWRKVAGRYAILVINA